MANEVRITVRADGTQKTNAELGSVDKKASGLSGTVQSLQKNWLAMGAAAGVAVVAVVGVGRAVVGLAMMASDLEESQNKVNVVFGESADAVSEFASTAATELGQTGTAVLAAAGGFGAMFSAIGLAETASADMSIAMVQLSTDMASFNNIGTDEALIKLRAGLAGEAEPLRQLGVFLSAAAVDAKALELGLAATTSALTEADKVTARYNLILEQTSIQQGDFERTSEGLANQSRILNAQIDELKTSLGEELVPVITEVVTGLNQIVAAMNSIPSEVTTTIKVGIESVLGALVPGFAVGTSALDVFGGGGGGQRFRTQAAAASEDQALGAAISFPGPAARTNRFHPGFFDDEVGFFATMFDDIEKITKKETGTLTGLAAEAANARIQIAQEQTAAVVDAFLSGGEEAVSIVRQEQAGLDAAWRDVAAGLEEFGLESPDRFRSMWEEMLSIQEEEQKELLRLRQDNLMATLEAERAVLAGRAGIGEFAQVARGRANPDLTPAEIAAEQRKQDDFQAFINELLSGNVSPTMAKVIEVFGTGMASVIENLIANQQVFIDALGNLQANATFTVELNGETFQNAVVRAGDDADASGRTVRTLVN